MITPIQFKLYNFNDIRSDAGVRADLARRPVEDILLTDFFGGVTQAEVTGPANREHLVVQDAPEEAVRDSYGKRANIA